MANGYYGPADAVSDIVQAIIKRNAMRGAQNMALEQAESLSDISRNYQEEQLNQEQNRRNQEYDSILNQLKNFGANTDALSDRTGSITNNSLIDNAKSYSSPVTPEEAMNLDTLVRNNGLQPGDEGYQNQTPTQVPTQQTPQTQPEYTNMSLLRDYLLKNDPGATNEDLARALLQRYQQGEDAYNEQKRQQQEFDTIQREHPEWIRGNYYTGGDESLNDEADAYNQQKEIERQQEAQRKEDYRRGESVDAYSTPDYFDMENAVQKNRARFIRDAVRKYGPEAAQIALEQYDNVANGFLNTQKIRQAQKADQDLENFMLTNPDLTNNPAHAAAYATLAQAQQNARGLLGLSQGSTQGMDNLIATREGKAGLIDAGGKIIPYRTNRSGQLLDNGPSFNKTLSPESILNAQTQQRGQDMTYRTNQAKIAQDQNQFDRKYALDREDVITRRIAAENKGNGMTAKQREEANTANTKAEELMNKFGDELASMSAEELLDPNKHTARDLKLELQRLADNGYMSQQDVNELQLQAEILWNAKVGNMNEVTRLISYFEDPVLRNQLMIQAKAYSQG
jgi:hypothetical protein